MYYLQDLEVQLASATEAYLESEEDAVRIAPVDSSEEKMPTIHLSMLFKWYSEDFGSDKTEILKWIYKNMAEEESVEKNGMRSRKGQLGEILGEKNADVSEYKLKYIPYDWGNNAKKK